MALTAVLSPDTSSADSPLSVDPLCGIYVTDDEYRQVDAHQHTLLRYPCGVAAGDRLRLRGDLHIEDHLGTRTGVVLQAGSIWKVLPGLPTEPLVIWLEDPRGELHTWDDESVRVDFQAIDAA